MHGSGEDREIYKLDWLPHTLIQSPLIGRQAELEDLLHLLGHRRWLSLIGVGGCGKTTLALHAVQRARHEFAHGACWIALDAVNDPALVSQTVATALGIETKPHLTSEGAGGAGGAGGAIEDVIEDVIIKRLATQYVLLVLDNCEHVLQASRAMCDVIYEHCPHVTLLTTSRTALGSPNETRWDVPLLTSNDAIALFMERSRAHIAPNGSTQSQALVAEICRRVDHLPLAIELAAARTKVLSLAQIRDRLAQTLSLPAPMGRAGADRHSTMSAALDWSYGLLTPPEQELFIRLSVFVGGFTLEAAEAVCADETLAADQVLSLLSQLMDHSLVVVSDRGADSDATDSVRYRLLEPVREFGSQQLGKSTCFNKVQHRHAEWCHRLVKEAAQHWRTREQPAWFDRLQTELGNLRAALHGCLVSRTPADLQLGLRIATDAYLYWESRGHSEEGERWLRELLDHTTVEIDIEVRVDATGILAHLLGLQGRYDQARQMSETMVTLAQQAETDALVAKSLNRLASSHYELGNFEQALQLLKEAEPIARGLSDTWLLSSVLNNRALVLQRVGDLHEAQRMFEELLVYRRASGDLHNLGITLHNLAMVLDSRGEYSQARHYSEEALIVWRDLGDRNWEANTLGLLAGVFTSWDRFGEAETYALACLQLLEQLGNRADQVYPLSDLARIALARGDLHECRDHLQRMHAFAQESGDKTQIARSLNYLALASAEEGDWMGARVYCVQAMAMRKNNGSRFGVATCLETAAHICSHTGQAIEAAQFLTAATAMREAIHRHHEPFEERLVAQTIKAIRKQISKDAFDDATQRGVIQAQAFQDAAQFALEVLQRQESEVAPDLRFSALGDVEVVAHGRQLAASDWTYAKSRELVFYLLLHSNATREEAGVDFWPDANTEQVRKRFSAALSHARNALGREHAPIILTEGRYAINPALRIWFDVPVYEQALDLAQRSLAHDEADEQAMRYLETATQLYRGDLLKDIDADWVIAQRESLRQKQLDALLKLGELYARASAARLPDAVAVLQRAVALNNYAEAAHVALIRVYIRLGERDRARRQYQTLLAALNDLGVPLSPEALALDSF